MVPRRCAVGLCTATLLAMAVSGCFSGDPELETAADNVQAPEAFHDQTTGAIRGTVLDDGLLPLEGVRVSLHESETTRTSDEGSFHFGFVAPGDHTLRFDTEGFQPRTTDVHVTAGEISEVSVQMASNGSATAAYYETRIQNGMDGCSVGYRMEDEPSEGISTSSLNYSYPLCNIIQSFPGGGQSIIPYPFGDTTAITGYWSETVWTPTQALGNGMFLHWSYEEAPSVHQPFAGDLGQSPLRLRIPMEKVWESVDNNTAGSVCTRENCTLWLWHSVGVTTVVAEPYGVGVGLQQRFEDFLTLFYNQEVPLWFTALADS